MSLPFAVDHADTSSLSFTTTSRSVAKPSLPVFVLSLVCTFWPTCQEQCAGFGFPVKIGGDRSRYPQLKVRVTGSAILLHDWTNRQKTKNTRIKLASAGFLRHICMVRLSWPGHAIPNRWPSRVPNGRRIWNDWPSQSPVQPGRGTGASGGGKCPRLSGWCVIRIQQACVVQAVSYSCFEEGNR